MFPFKESLRTNTEGQSLVYRFRANYEYMTTTDSQGRFTVHGFGPKPHFQLQLRKDGYVFINWGVNVREDGIHWHVVGLMRTPKTTGRFKDSA